MQLRCFIKSYTKLETSRHKTNWVEIETSRNPNVCYRIFLKKFNPLYDEYFPIKIMRLKTYKVLG